MVFPAVDSLDDYGGELADLVSITDPTTDRPAEGMNAALASVAAMTNTAVQCWARVTVAATTGAMVLADHYSAWGNTNPVAPTLARTSTGLFTITWPTSITTELGDTHTTALRAAAPVNCEGSALYFAQATKTSANVITLRVFTTTFALDDAAGVTFWVGAY